MKKNNNFSRIKLIFDKIITFFAKMLIFYRNLQVKLKPPALRASLLGIF